ncbi:MAG TPA: aryl-sulfate sulfotransferase [Gemmatimonadales bacterium]|nr:aryl-sulfate sulfotransferase [Gemmatimonadales bacterium]
MVPAPGNVLTARISVVARGFDSLRVRYTGEADGARVTPVQRLAGRDSAAVRVAGLRAGTEYLFQVEGWTGDRLLSGDTSSFTTGPLPAALNNMSLEFLVGTATRTSLLVPTLLGQDGYLVIFDSVGTIRWYLNTSPWFPGAAPADTKQLPNGNILAYLGSTNGWNPVFGQYYEFSLEGNVVRTYAAPLPLYTDNHELLLDFADSLPVTATFFSYDIRNVDRTAWGGTGVIALAGHQIIRQRLAGGVEFFWNAWDRLSLEDWIEEPQSAKQQPSGDFDHPNSLDVDADGSYIVSWRNMGEVTKIDRRIGAIIWRWGGRNNQFTFVNDPLNLFSGQHSVRVLPNGNYLLYDNGWRHVPSESRVAEYRLDTDALTATLVWEYRHAPALFTPYVGNVARLQDGNTFISWGGAGRMQEVAPDLATRWEVQVRNNGVPAIFYRSVLVPDLYRYRLP